MGNPSAASGRTGASRPCLSDPLHHRRLTPKIPVYDAGHRGSGPRPRGSAPKRAARQSDRLRLGLGPIAFPTRSLPPGGMNGGHYASIKGHAWQALCVGKRRTDRQISQPRAAERTDRLPTPPTTRANPPGERSPAAQRRTSSSEAQAKAERTALGALLGDKASAEGGSRNWATKVQRQGDQVRDAPA